MKINWLMVGKTDSAYLQTGMDEYTGRLKHYVPLAMMVISDIKNQKALSQDQIRVKEGEMFLAEIKDQDFVVLLDERGVQYSSPELARFVEKLQIRSVRQLVFVIGGAYGFSEAVYQRANEKISLSKLTFSHQMVRLIFAEQLYRAYTIIRGEKYHHG